MSVEEQFKRLFANKMDSDEAKDFLIKLYERGESSQEIATAAKIMREYSLKLDIDSTLKESLIDIVGTGGDRSGSFNISSTVSLIVSSLGLVVAKHGNRSITSKSGSAEMLEILGVNLNLTPKDQEKMLYECGFTFMFALNHHPSMKHIMPIRRSIPHRTIFNLLGPLTNPAGAKKYLLGVFDRSYIKRVTETLLLLGVKRAYVVSSEDGLDEVSVSGITHYGEIRDGNISYSTLDPQEYGIKLSTLPEIVGGDPKENAKITLDILNSKEMGAKRDIALLNSALALVVDKKARDIKDGIDMAKEAIDSKLALNHLKKIVEISNKF